MDVCPFCKILQEKGSRFFKEHEYSFVIFSDPRLVPGHLLVIPKRHAERLAELSLPEKAELLSLVETYEEKILKAGAAGCDIRQNYRPFLKPSALKVNHMHFHLLPRENEDVLFEKSMRFERDVFWPLPEDELERYRKALD